MSDDDLLREFARSNHQAAFAALVERHLDLVYSVARRHVQSTHLAEEVAQSVFVDLARSAAKFPTATPIVAWLHLVSGRTAIDVVRREARRRAREAAAVLASDDSPETAMKSPSPWATIEPLLDEAVGSLAPSDRTAILLRFFENRSLREIGGTLGLSEDAAQKRVTRALDRLRDFLIRRGITVTSVGLATDLSANALQVAPAGLGAAIANTTALTGAAVSGTALETSHLIAMTTLQKAVAVATLVVIAGAGLYQARVVASQSAELSALARQNTRTENEARDQRLAHTAVVAKLQDVDRQIDARLTATVPVDPADDALQSQMNQWLAQLDRIKEFLTERPAWNIPELKLLTEQDWFNAAATTERLESEEQFRRATSGLRALASSYAAQKIMKALNSYVRTSNGVLPDSPFELASHFDAAFDLEILSHYEMLKTGKLSDVPRNELTRILAPKPADVEYDAYSYIGTNGYGNTGVAMAENIRHARRQFAQANTGGRADSAEQLVPYLRWPASAAAVQKYLERQSSGAP